MKPKNYLTVQCLLFLLAILVGAAGLWLVEPNLSLDRDWGADWSAAEKRSAAKASITPAESAIGNTVHLEQLLNKAQVISAGEPIDGAVLSLDPKKAEKVSSGSESAPAMSWVFRERKFKKLKGFNIGSLLIELNNTNPKVRYLNLTIHHRKYFVKIPIKAGRGLYQIDMAEEWVAGSDLDSIELFFGGAAPENMPVVLKMIACSLTSPYASRSVGLAYQSIADITRPAIYQWTPGKIGLPLNPKNGFTTFKFGLGVLPDSSMIEAKVSLSIEGQVRELAKIQVRPGKWTDHSIELGDVSNKNAYLLLEATSEKPVPLLWASPRLVRGGRPGRLVCVFLMDDLRADFVEGFPGRKNTGGLTPTLKTLGDQAYRFTAAIANGPTTHFAIPALFTGLWTVNNGFTRYDAVPNSVPTLAEVMRFNGFLTAQITVNPHSGPMANLHRGFDYFWGREAMYRVNVDRKIEILTRDRISDEARARHSKFCGINVINDHLFSFLTNHRNEDVFLYLHLMDAHGPLVPEKKFADHFRAACKKLNIQSPPDRQALLTKGTGAFANYETPIAEQLIVGLYKDAAANTDDAVNRLITQLKKTGLWERTTFIFLADHGNHMREHKDVGFYNHAEPHYLPGIRIPLIIHHPELPGQAEIQTAVQQTDIMPTLLDLLRIQYDPAQFDGASLVGLMKGESNDYFSHRSLISNGEEISLLTDKTHWINLKNQKSPIYRWRNDLYEQHPVPWWSRSRAVRDLIKSVRRAPKRPTPPPDAGAIQLNRKTIDHLKQLGYM